MAAFLFIERKQITNYAPKQEALAKTAFELFLKQGYENTTVTQIMKAAGLTKAGMYHYFPSKEAIRDAAIDLGMAAAIEQTRAEIAGRSVMEKMLRFTGGADAPDNMMRKFREYRRRNRDSYASYRIREKGVHAFIPLLEEIIREGIAAGIYETPYPRQVAEFMVLLVRAISEDNILPATDWEGSALRVEALLELMQSWLHLDKAHLNAFSSMFEEERHFLKEEHKQYE